MGLIMSEILLEVKNLKKYYPIRQGIIPRTTGFVKAVSQFSCTVRKGETVGLVGESGCGKTTAGRTILRLMEPTEGEAFFDGVDIFKLSARDLLTYRRRMQIIFQDPYASLNPRMTVADIIGDGMELHKIASGGKRKKRVAELMERVGLYPEYANRYPHEFSGGQRQRIGIARALALNPEFIVCDEAVSALDVSIQAQILNLLQDLQRDLNISYLFISHDLSVIRHICHRINVMYLGEVVEEAPSEVLFKNPQHPYTKALLSAIPNPNPEIRTDRTILQGDVPSPRKVPDGCYFHPRCPVAEDRCSVEKPKLLNYGQGEVEHFASCLKLKEPGKA